MKKIFLSNGQVSLVSDEDHLYLAGYTWSLDSFGYTQIWVNVKHQGVHRIVAKRMKLNLIGKEIVIN